MKKLIITALVFAAVLVAGCTQELPVTEVVIPGHGSQVYTFSNDIRQSLLVNTNNPEGIKAIGRQLTVMNVVFDGSNQQDNAYFQVVLTNIVAKLPIYYSYEGRLIRFNSFYSVDNKWYNSTNEEIERPEFNGPVLWLVGPSAANETSLTLTNGTIYLSGDSYRGLTMVGDKLVLLFFGIDSVPSS